ncbi:MAG: HD domain-containing protein, partial [Clostridia bacterium]|nr:HD domain-containing protein [Clostridia bacterium]
MILNRNAVTAAFERYVAGYNAADPKIKLKIDHTYRVAGLCERIAADISAADVDLAWLCGMLHDIGR